MISAAELQYAYVKLYAQLRKYIWNFDTVTLIAELEVACYQLFPDIDKVKDLLAKLHRAVKTVESDDEDMKKTFDKFEDLLKDVTDEDRYAKLNWVQEVV